MAANMADVTITPANVLASATAQVNRAGTAGASVTAGQPVYRDGDQSLKPADANAPAPANSVAGIALNGAEAGQPLAIVTEDSDFAGGFPATAGTVYVLSTNAGAIAPTSDLATGATAIVLGVGKGNGKLNFKPLAGGAVP
jgi:hypothetical protein